MRSDVRRTTMITLCLAGAVGMAACQGGSAPTASADPENAFSSGLSGLAEEDRLPSAIERDAAFLDSFSDTPAEPTVATGPPPEANLGPALEITPAQPAPPDAIPDASQAPDEPTPEPAPEESPQDRRERLIAELAASLRAEARASDTPLSAYTALAALELLAPGVLGPAEGLSERERETLDAWRQMIRDVREGMAGTADAGGAIPDAAAALHERLSSFRPLRITSALLCARVEGFGRYTALPSQLLAGRAHPAIVYVEVEHFGHRPGAGDAGEPGFLVELTQELSLYHDADGVLAWRRAEQEVKDFSRNRRHDFFVVQRVDLPQTLTVGAYRLKITLRDKVTGATAETILPLEVVADANLIRPAR